MRMHSIRASLRFGSNQMSKTTTNFRDWVKFWISGKPIHTNGGIDLVRGSGEVKLESQNGGIVVRLPEGSWAGELLEARSQNGGLILHVPEGFNSGIEAETSAHSRIDCRLPGCPQQDRSESEQREPKRVQLGGPSPVVHVSTRNGSLQIVPAR